MGRTIGFNLYIKEKSKEGKLVRAPGDIDQDYYLQGRTDVSRSWSDLFDIFQDETGNFITCVPVFQKELDGYEVRGNSRRTRYKYINFNTFYNFVDEAIKEEFKLTKNYINSLKKRIHKLDSDIDRLRKLQSDCTAEQSYAFEKWGEEIAEKEEVIELTTSEIENFYEDDYEYQYAKNTQQLLEKMKEYFEKDEYFVIPFVDD